MNERLSELFEKYLNDALTKSEWEEFRSLLAESSASDVDPAMEALFQGRSLAYANLEVDKGAIFRTIENQIDEAASDKDGAFGFRREGSGRRIFLFPRIARYAAAALITGLMGVGAYRYWIGAKQATAPGSGLAPVTPVARLLPPANAGAVLTLANGSQIALTEQHGVPANNQPDLKAVRLDSGLVDYHAKASGSPDMAAAFNSLSTSKGTQYQLILPDGSHVWLNSASSIRYPVVFPGEKREVELTGEAYFEVAPDQNRPFYVKVNGMKVEVLGTAFNVMAYSDEATLRTTLFHGSVRVDASGNSLLLKPGEQAGLSEATRNLSLQQANLDEVAAWRKGVFLFKKQSIEEIMRQISRWYDVEITYRGKKPDVQLSGALSRREDASQLLDILQATNNVHFTIEGNKIIVTQ